MDETIGEIIADFNTMDYRLDKIFKEVRYLKALIKVRIEDTVAKDKAQSDQGHRSCDSREHLK